MDEIAKYVGRCREINRDIGRYRVMDEMAKWGIILALTLTLASSPP